jgi:hypothetical protein
MDSRFDPRPQIHYSTSYFKEPDFPVDIYGCYLLIKGKRFFVNLKRDGRTGEFVGAHRTDSVGGISYTEQKKLFKELEKKQAQAQQKPQSQLPPPVARQQAELTLSPHVPPSPPYHSATTRGMTIRGASRPLF